MLVGETKEYIKKVLRNKHSLSPMLWGPPGIGKTSICRQAAEELGMKFLCLQISVYNPIDMAGLPCPDFDNKVARYFPPSFLEPALLAKEPMLLLFDEMSSAPPSVQVAAQRVILEHKFGEFSLPACVRTIATGNRECDRANTFHMPTPLANRFLHVENIKASLDDWKKWAIPNHIDSLIISYLNYKPLSINLFPKDPSVKAFPTPRTWEMLSHLLEESDISDPDFFTVCETAIGTPETSMFTAFAKVYGQLPDIDSILNGRSNYKPDKARIDLMYALSGALVQHVSIKQKTNEEFEDRINNFIAYTNNNFSPEMQMATFNDAFNVGLAKPIAMSKNFKLISKMIGSWLY